MAGDDKEATKEKVQRLTSTAIAGVKITGDLKVGGVSYALEGTEMNIEGGNLVGAGIPNGKYKDYYKFKEAFEKLSPAEKKEFFEKNINSIVIVSEPTELENLLNKELKRYRDGMSKTITDPKQVERAVKDLRSEYDNPPGMSGAERDKAQAAFVVKLRNDNDRAEGINLLDFEVLKGQKLKLKVESEEQVGGKKVKKTKVEEYDLAGAKFWVTNGMVTGVYTPPAIGDAEAERFKEAFHKLTAAQRADFIKYNEGNIKIIKNTDGKGPPVTAPKSPFDNIDDATKGFYDKIFGEAWKKNMKKSSLDVMPGMAVRFVADRLGLRDMVTQIGAVLNGVSGGSMTDTSGPGGGAASVPRTQEAIARADTPARGGSA